MKWTLCICSLLLFQSFPARCQPIQGPEAPPLQVNKAFYEFVFDELKSLQIQSTANKATAAEERLSMERRYRYNSAGTLLSSDSTRLIYSNGRGSKFDYNSMTYQLSKNYSEVYPPRVEDVDFDLSYGLSNHDTTQRYYDGSNRLIREVRGAQTHEVFQYDASNRLLSILSLQIYAGQTDTIGRILYVYDPSGFKTEFRSEKWIAATSIWEPTNRVIYTNDAIGRPTKLSYETYVSSGNYHLDQTVVITYSGSSVLPATTLWEGISPVTSQWQKLSKAYYAYLNSTLTDRNDYIWNVDSAAWLDYHKERRHLNAAGLPDTIVYLNSSDYYVYEYNSQNNPISYSSRLTSLSTPVTVIRWDYEPKENVGVNHVERERLELYPNPVSAQIQVKGITEGSYQIFNTAGLLIQSGSISQNSGVPVQNLPSGMYLIRVMTSTGRSLHANFIHK